MNLSEEERREEVLNLAMNLRLAAASLSDTALSLDKQAWQHRDAAKRIYQYAEKVVERIEGEK